MAAFKTLAFNFNLIDNLIKKKKNTPTVLVICMRKHLITMFGMKQALIPNVVWLTVPDRRSRK